MMLSQNTSKIQSCYRDYQLRKHEQILYKKHKYCAINKITILLNMFFLFLLFSKAIMRSLGSSLE